MAVSLKKPKTNVVDANRALNMKSRA